MGFSINGTRKRRRKRTARKMVEASWSDIYIQPLDTKIHIIIYNKRKKRE